MKHVAASLVISIQIVFADYLSFNVGGLTRLHLTENDRFALFCSLECDVFTPGSRIAIIPPETAIMHDDELTFIDIRNNSCPLVVEAKISKVAIPHTGSYHCFWYKNDGRGEALIKERKIKIIVRPKSVYTRQ